jgi:hypothetical protein
VVSENEGLKIVQLKPRELKVGMKVRRLVNPMSVMNWREYFFVITGIKWDAKLRRYKIRLLIPPVLRNEAVHSFAIGPSAVVEVLVDEDFPTELPKQQCTYWRTGPKVGGNVVVWRARCRKTAAEAGRCTYHQNRRRYP